MELTLTLVLSLLACRGYAVVTDPLQYVDQLIGTQAGGNVFAGASLPYGLAKASADTDSQSNQGGFTTDGANVTGFSGMHDSGTGSSSPSLGLFPLFAYGECKNDTINGCVFPKKARATPYINDTLKASPGFFGLQLQNGVKAEMTTTQHASLFRFSFPSEGSGSPIIFMDLTDLSNSRQSNASIAVDATSGRMTGNARFLPSFGEGDYVAYFCADFQGSSIRDNGIFVDSRGSADVKEVKVPAGIRSGTATVPAGAFNRFKSKDSVLVRLGTSFKSSEQACSLAEAEIPDYDFQGIQTAAEDAWRAKMTPISVSTNGVDEKALKNFYSGIYRTMMNPQNYTGVVPDVDENTIYFDSFYCIWDLFRSQLPFLTVLDTPAVEDMLQGLLTLYNIHGWLPDCHMSLSKGYTQGGSNADVVMADAYQKINSSKIDWGLVYEAVVKDAEVEPYDWCCQGRGGLDSWKSLNYIPIEDFDYKGFGTKTRSVSRSLEYSYNDFCISVLASALGNMADTEKYSLSSGNWQNLYKADQISNKINSTESTGFTGFFQPKYQNMTWAFQEPLRCSNIDTNTTSICSLQVTAGETFESSIWEYSFYVPHDQAKLIKTMGGAETFVKRLEYMHDENITYIGNEPSFLTVYQYHYAGRPALSAKRAHFYIPEFFSPTAAGLPGNDDSGTMGAFLAFAMMGLFPNPGQDVYLITPPFFEDVNITSPVTGKMARIRNVGFDPTYEDVYIQRAELDGKEWTKNWITHDFFTEGRELVLYLGKSESEWGTKVEDLPPSLSAYE
ncbi:probable alpha-1,2-mannosidase family protein [Ramularia collo-cygni]|uniref:Probable alpha-1,2-mannosidase family protein n=1 Tax=Ramularia collo-cygni TaxID=112498 RepID=A0A2D3UPJ5_9PEZI|nr:probable alpha-1,2-mannosidase family protein [Ramularia collo-cygni]CZT14825.1 probable alpha-1,2-mannosidase family protein [Ramularia collo-cygni]